MGNLRDVYNNTYYRVTCIYISVLVTLIFGFQMYRYFVAAPASQITKECPTQEHKALALIPVIGVLFDV